MKISDKIANLKLILTA